jgi:hypothetical protein
MSDPKKYEHVSDGYTARFINPKTGHAAPYGEYVRYDDYARLRISYKICDEYAEGLEGFIKSQDADIKRHKAEVERLTKAGDEMAADLIGEFGSYNSVYGWNAAKEGNAK